MFQNTSPTYVYLYGSSQAVLDIPSIDYISHSIASHASRKPRLITIYSFDL